MTLSGAFYEPDRAAEAATVAAWVVNHGSEGNFTSSLVRTLAEGLAAHGYAVLAPGNRGHDVAWRQAGKEGLFGNAYEVMVECRLDLQAALGWLEGRGYRRIGLLGHSLGGVKAAYYHMREQDPRVRALVLLSAPRLSFSYFSDSEKREEFRRHINQASRLIEEGKAEALMTVTFPLAQPTVMSARSYLDKYGMEERFNLLKYADKITVPLLFLVGAPAVQVIHREYGSQLVAAATKSPGCQHITIPESNQVYTGREKQALQGILEWVRGLPA